MQGVQGVADEEVQLGSPTNLRLQDAFCTRPDRQRNRGTWYICCTECLDDKPQVGDGIHHLV